MTGTMAATISLAGSAIKLLKEIGKPVTGRELRDILLLTPPRFTEATWYRYTFYTRDCVYTKSFVSHRPSV